MINMLKSEKFQFAVTLSIVLFTLPVSLILLILTALGKTELSLTFSSITFVLALLNSILYLKVLSLNKKKEKLNRLNN